ncbi:MAG: signal transduction histidine kinase [Polyangiales bacterium]|jgi:signal transduction histidine kinase
MSFLSRIVPAIAFLVTVCVAVTAFMLLRASTVGLRSARMSDIETAMTVSQTRFDGEVGEVVRSTRLLQRLPPISGLARAHHNNGVDPLDDSTYAQWCDRLAVIFGEMLRSHVNYLQVRYIGVADGGRELVRVDRSPGELEMRRVSGEALQEKESESYFRAVLALSRDDVSISPIDLNREHGVIASPHVPVFRVAAPVVDPVGGELFGFVIINVDARAILTNLAEAFPSYTVFVVRGDGHFVLHPEPEYVFGFDLDHPPTATRDFPPLAPVIRGEVRSTHLSDEDNNRLLGAVRLTSGASNDEAELTLVVVSDLEELGGLSWQAILQVVPSVVLFGTLALFLGLWLGRLITRPFRLLAKAVGAMETDDQTLDMPEGLTGEARALADVLERSIETLRANDRIKASNRELIQFAYLASHDLREPVRTIASYAELLEEDYGEIYDEEGRTFLTFIRRSCERMNALIAGLLAHSQLGADATAELVPIRELVNEVVEDLNASIRAASASVYVSEEFPVLRVYPLVVRLLFQNLLSNALKFRREGVPTEVRVEAEKVGDEWTFSVTDNGPGIPTEHRERVFEIFQRLHGREENAGSGIGLAHCRKIVNLHQGRMWIEDAPGGGTTFFFILREREAS